MAVTLLPLVNPHTRANCCLIFVRYVLFNKQFANQTHTCRIDVTIEAAIELVSSARRWTCISDGIVAR
jgi:hypothetical protein